MAGENCNLTRRAILLLLSAGLDCFLTFWNSREMEEFNSKFSSPPLLPHCSTESHTLKFQFCRFQPSRFEFGKRSVLFKSH